MRSIITSPCMISRVDLGRLSGIWWSEIWDGGLGTVRIILGEYGTEDYLPPPHPPPEVEEEEAPVSYLT